MKPLIIAGCSLAVLIALIVCSFIGLRVYCSNPSPRSSVSETEDWTDTESNSKRGKPPTHIHNKIHTESTNSPSNYDEKKWKEEFWCDLKGTGFALAWGTLLLVIVTFGLILMGFRQEEVAKKELRAYIGIENVVVRYYPPTFAQATVTIRNGGPTPARKFRRFLNVGVFPANHNEFEIGELTPPMSLGPNIPHDMRKIVDDGITLQTAVAISPSGAQTRVFVWGLITYEDTFDREQRTYFCFVNLEVKKGADNVPELWAMHPANQGNNDAT